MFLEGERIDIFFRNKKQYLVSALAQYFGDGQARKKVPAGSSACNDRVHRTLYGGIQIGGSAAPRAMPKNVRLRRLILAPSKGLLDPPAAQSHSTIL